MKDCLLFGPEAMEDWIVTKDNLDDLLEVLLVSGFVTS